jgi:hypothetical protein
MARAFEGARLMVWLKDASAGIVLVAFIASSFGLADLAAAILAH